MSANDARTWSGRITRFAITDSTNERALAAIASGDARHGDVFVAGEQTRGRGRRGATWHSPAGEGLYFSIALLPRVPVSPPALTMASGVAVWRALRALGLRDVELKWPNDLFVGPAKLVGILVETRGLDPQAPHYVVGIGINVAQRSFAPELLAERAVTSLALRGVVTTPEAVLRAALAALEPALERALAESAARGSPLADAVGTETRSKGSDDPSVTADDSPGNAKTTNDTVAKDTTAREYAEAAGLLGARVGVDGPRGEVRGRLRSLDTVRGVAIEVEHGASTDERRGAPPTAGDCDPPERRGPEQRGPEQGRTEPIPVEWIPLEHVRALTKL